MADSPTQSVAGRTDGLFDRYTLPKTALTVILAASLIGTWVTVTLAGGTGFDAIAKWAYFVALGVLTGGLLWKHAFDRIAAGVLAVLAISGSVGVAAYVGRISTVLVVSFGVGFLALVAVGVAIIWRNGSVTDRFILPAITYRSNSPPRDDEYLYERIAGSIRHPLGLLALGVALALVAITALAEVASSD